MSMLEDPSEAAQFMVENATCSICTGTILLCLIGDFHSSNSHDVVYEFSKPTDKEVSYVLSNVTVLIFVWHSYSIHAGIRLINTSD
jgi:hypothetical protein